MSAPRDPLQFRLSLNGIMLVIKLSFTKKWSGSLLLLLLLLQEELILILVLVAHLLSKLMLIVKLL